MILFILAAKAYSLLITPPDEAKCYVDSLRGIQGEPCVNNLNNGNLNCKKARDNEIIDTNICEVTGFLNNLKKQRNSEVSSYFDGTPDILDSLKMNPPNDCSLNHPPQLVVPLSNSNIGKNINNIHPKYAFRKISVPKRNSDNIQVPPPNPNIAVVTATQTIIEYAEKPPIIQSIPNTTVYLTRDAKKVTVMVPSPPQFIHVTKTLTSPPVTRTEYMPPVIIPPITEVITSVQTVYMPPQYIVTTRYIEMPPKVIIKDSNQYNNPRISQNINYENHQQNPVKKFVKVPVNQKIIEKGKVNEKFNVTNAPPTKVFSKLPLNPVPANFKESNYNWGNHFFLNNSNNNSRIKIYKTNNSTYYCDTKTQMCYYVFNDNTKNGMPIIQQLLIGNQQAFNKSTVPALTNLSETCGYINGVDNSKNTTKCSPQLQNKAGNYAISLLANNSCADNMLLCLKNPNIFRNLDLNLQNSINGLTSNQIVPNNHSPPNDNNIDYVFLSDLIENKN